MGSYLISLISVYDIKKESERNTGEIIRHAFCANKDLQVVFSAR